MLAPISEVGVGVFRVRDGAVVWRHAAEHAQQLEVGDFLRGVAGPHVAVNARTYPRNGEAGIAAQVHWFDAKGRSPRSGPPIRSTATLISSRATGAATAGRSCSGTGSG